MRSWRFIRAAICAFLLVGVSACAEDATRVSPMAGSGRHVTPGYKVGSPYQVAGIWYYPKVDYTYDETGVASWYGPGFHGRYTANGEIFDTNELMGAHKTLPLPSLVRVTNLENGRQIIVRVNDRGPFSGQRIIDLSRRGAQLLGFANKGTAMVRVQILPDESRALAELSMHTRSGYAEAVPSGELVDAPREAAPAPAPLPAPREDVASEPLPAAEPVAYEASAQPIMLSDSQPAPQPSRIEGREDHGEFIPAAVVSKAPVDPRHNRIFVQAGAFSLADNAEKLRSQLEKIAPASIIPSNINGQTLYRVRIGPFATVAEADAGLTHVVASGQKAARITID